jgi:hypothetical protein
MSEMLMQHLTAKMKFSVVSAQGGDTPSHNSSTTRNIISCHHRKTVLRDNNANKDDVNSLGVSVHWLTTGFLEEIKEVGLDVESATIHQLESFQDDEPPGLIRQRGQHLVSPVDGKLGTSYVHALLLESSGKAEKEEERLGPATWMLSYTWGYTVRDITSTLSLFCRTHQLDPKQPHLYMDVLLVRQPTSRVGTKRTGGQRIAQF